MGSYLNPGNKGFQENLNSEIYVDKTGLIEKTNAVLDTRQKFLCVSRPRRFGKSMAADMLAAYYERGEDADLLFRSLKISKAESYRAHLKDYHGNLLLVGINYDKGTKKHECVIESMKNNGSDKIKKRPSRSSQNFQKLNMSAAENWEDR